AVVGAGEGDAGKAPEGVGLAFEHDAAAPDEPADAAAHGGALERRNLGRGDGRIGGAGGQGGERENDSQGLEEGPLTRRACMAAGAEDARRLARVPTSPPRESCPGCGAG